LSLEPRGPQSHSSYEYIGKSGPSQRGSSSIRFSMFNIRGPQRCAASRRGMPRPKPRCGRRPSAETGDGDRPPGARPRKGGANVGGHPARGNITQIGIRRVGECKNGGSALHLTLWHLCGHADRDAGFAMRCSLERSCRFRSATKLANHLRPSRSGRETAPFG
jgi:hypothetical protein